VKTNKYLRFSVMQSLVSTVSLIKKVCLFSILYITSIKLIRGHQATMFILSIKEWYKPEGRGFDSRGHWISFFNWPNPSSRNMALGSTQLLTEMSTSNLPGGKVRPVRKVDNLTAICEPIV
jgi:hypothetical protein